MGALVKDKTMVNDVLNSDIPPFDLLSEDQLAVLTQSLSIVYFEASSISRLRLGLAASCD